MPMDKLFEKILAYVNTEIVLAVQLVSSLVKTTLNLIWRDVYTDWVTPYVAMVIGLIYGISQLGANMDGLLCGLATGGGAIVFQELWDRGVEGWSVLRGKGKDHPVMAAKVQHSSSLAESQIEKVKRLMKRKDTK